MATVLILHGYRAACVSESWFADAPIPCIGRNCSMPGRSISQPIAHLCLTRITPMPSSLKQGIDEWYCYDPAITERPDMASALFAPLALLRPGPQTPLEVGEIRSSNCSRSFHSSQKESSGCFASAIA